MIVLSAIGRFFKKIWDWIKNTAWIQPLLIVGIIFGVIFSIPSIVKAVNAGKKEKATYNTYYHNFKLSLEGEVDPEDSSKYKSDADEFTYKLEAVLDREDGAEAAFKEKYSDLGNKFFIAYVAKDCDKCEDAKEGFSTFQKKLNQNDAYKSDDESDEFHMVTIFADDENSQTTDSQTAFVKYLERHQDFFEDVGSVAYTTAYYDNNKLNDSDVEALETADPDNFLTPTILLVELKNSTSENYGVTGIMFGVDGSDKNDKARTLLDCWNHTGDFSYNKKND